MAARRVALLVLLLLAAFATTGSSQEGAPGKIHTALQIDFNKKPTPSTLTGWDVAAGAQTPCTLQEVAGPSDWTMKPGAPHKAAKLESATAGESVVCARSFTPEKGLVTIEWMFRTSPSGGQGVTLRASDGQTVASLAIDATGNLRRTGADGVIQQIADNTWYKASVVAKTEAALYDVYVNDILAVSDAPFENPAPDVARIEFRAGGDAPGALYVDTLSVTSRPMPERLVAIDLGRERQPVDEVGFCHEGRKYPTAEHAISPEVQAMLDEHMSLFRDRFPGKEWEPANDNASPAAIDMGRFATTSPAVRNTLLRLKEMQKRGVRTILGIWDVADWMVTNPDQKQGRTIANMDELAESVAAFLLHGKAKHGLAVDYVDVNETEMVGINIHMTVPEYAAFIKKCAALFEKHRLTTRVNLGSTLKWGEPYVAALYNDAEVRAVSGVPSFHSYRGIKGEPNDNSTFVSWGKFRQAIGRNLWCTATDYDAFYEENPERLDFRGAAEMAYDYWRVYYLARASATAGWYWRPELPSHDVHRAYLNAFEPGGSIVEASQDYPGVFTVAYQHAAKKKFAMQVLNANSKSDAFVISGVPNQPLTLVRSRAGERYQKIGTFTPTDHKLSVTLEGNSFNTFTGSLD